MASADYQIVTWTGFGITEGGNFTTCTIRNISPKDTKGVIWGVADIGGGSFVVSSYGDGVWTVECRDAINQ